jgi:uridine kinase
VHQRRRFTADLAEAALGRRRRGRTLVVGVTGMELSGAEELAAELIEELSLRGETPVEVPLRYFFRPEAQWLAGAATGEAEAYYARAYAVDQIVTWLLRPVRAGDAVEVQGEGEFKDFMILADPGDILVLSGPFLMRSDLHGMIDYLVYVETSSAVALRRAAQRGVPQELVTRRYLPAERLHQATRPAGEHADLVVDLEDPGAPRILWKRHGAR